MSHDFQNPFPMKNPSQSQMDTYLKSSFLMKLGLDQIAIDRLRKPLSIEQYKTWIANDRHGSMQYLKNHIPLKEDPNLIHANLNSVICVTQPYWNQTIKNEFSTPARTALYSQNQDYHFWLKEKLVQMIELLSVQFPNEVFLPFVDSGPILERDLAYQMGMGWFGKNSCLIHPKLGSLFFIAEILTTLKLSDVSEIAPLPDFCGTCTRCIEACPTSAIREDRTLNAPLCISYLTIESREIAPPNLRPKIGDWFFGCDICQTVCPWNQKLFRKSPLLTVDQTSFEKNLTLKSEKRTELIEFLIEILSLSGKQLQKKFKGSPLLRAGPFGLRRNAMFVVANQNLFELKGVIQKFHSDEKLGELATWTLEQLN